MASTQSTYRSVDHRSEGVYKEKGSKFIGIALRCYSESEAKVFLEQIKKEHYQARHVCYAYRFGVDKKVYRANDDGEPSNSAGQPIYGQIQAFDLSNTLIAVVRYYGGTKLGVGGLIHAYRTAAKEALISANLVEVEVYMHLSITFDYSKLSDVMNWIKSNKLILEEQDFGNEGKIRLSIPLEVVEEVRSGFSELVTEIKELGIY